MTDPTTTPPNWQDAQAVIGPHTDQDYILDLDAHADLYGDKAPGFAALLRASAARAHAEAYARYDSESIAARDSYMRWMFRTNLGAFLTSVFGALAMAWQLISGGLALPAIWPLAHMTTLLALCATISAGLGAAGLYLLRNGRLLETWMTRRAQAETQRIGYFETVIAKASQGPAQVQLLGLEYFLRYQFEVQRSYYTVRAGDHRTSADRTVTIGAAGAVVATVASASGVTFTGETNWLPALSVVGAAIGAYSIGREQMTQDRRNAERYERIAAALTSLAAKLDDVRGTAQAGAGAGIDAFTRAVNEQISNEHRQWLDQSEAMRLAMDRIERALDPKDVFDATPPNPD